MQSRAGKKAVVTHNTECRFETVFILCDVLWGTLVPLFFTAFFAVQPSFCHLNPAFSETSRQRKPNMS